MAFELSSTEIEYAQAIDELFLQIYPSLSLLCSSGHVDCTLWEARLRKAGEHTTTSSDATERIAAVLKLAVDAINVYSGAREYDRLFDILHILSDRSRSEIWRGPLGSRGVVDICVQLLNAVEVDCASPWLAETIRLLGNCCVTPSEATQYEQKDDRASRPELHDNREEIALRLRFNQVVPRLEIPVLRKVTLAFLYNLCADNGKLQASVVQEGLRHRIIAILRDSDAIESGYIVLCCSMLRWESDQGTIDADPPKTLQTLLDLQWRQTLSLGCAVTIMATICTSLASNPEQGRLEIARLLNLYKDTFDSQDKLDAYEAERDDDDPAASEVCSTFMTALCEVVSQDAFAPSIEVIHTISSWLVDNRDDMCRCSLEILATLACKSEDVVLTILATPPAAGQTVSAAIVGIISNTTEGAMFRSVFRFIQNSARSPTARQILGDAGVLEASSRCWLQELNKQLHLSAVIQTKRLLRESSSNILRFISRPRPPKTTTLHSLLDKFTNTEDSDVRTQIGLILCEMCVFLYGEHQPDTYRVAVSPRPEIEVTLDEGNMNTLSGSSKNPKKLCQARYGPTIEEVRSAMDHVFPMNRLLITKPLVALAQNPNPQFAKQAWLTLLIICQRKEMWAVVYAGIQTKEGIDVFRALLPAKNANATSQASAVSILRVLEAYVNTNGTGLSEDLRTILHDLEATMLSLPSSDT